MKLNEWLKNNFKHITLSENYYTSSSLNGAYIKVSVGKLQQDLANALLSTDSIDDFISLSCALIEQYKNITLEPVLSEKEYHIMLMKLRLDLSKSLTLSKDKMYEKWLKILERRCASTWNTKTVKIEQPENDNRNVNITFTVV